MNTSISSAWLIIFETCLKDDSGIDLHDTDIDFLKFNKSIFLNPLIKYRTSDIAVKHPWFCFSHSCVSIINHGTKEDICYTVK